MVFGASDQGMHRPKRPGARSGPTTPTNGSTGRSAATDPDITTSGEEVPDPLAISA
jgi:hypothetical protein